MLDSLVSGRVYDVIKTIYHTHGGEGDDQTRLSVIQNTLGGLLLANIATLDAIVSHFTRLIELTSADEAYINDLSATFAPCILRPRQESIVTQHDKHTQRLFRDLLSNKESIFGELKRERSLNAGRTRALSSTDESSRRVNEQARARAVIARSRPSSPAPTATSHRRDSSRGGGEFPRLPINPTSPPGTGPNGSTNSPRYRQSLEVPGGVSGTPTTATASSTTGPLSDHDPSQHVNDSDQDSPTSASTTHGEQSIPHQPPPTEPKGSISRVGRGYQPQRKSMKQSQDTEENFYGAGNVPDGRLGFNLTDKAMDDD